MEKTLPVKIVVRLDADRAYGIDVSGVSFRETLRMRGGAIRRVGAKVTLSVAEPVGATAYDPSGAPVASMPARDMARWLAENGYVHAGVECFPRDPRNASVALGAIWLRGAPLKPVVRRVAALESGA